MLRWLRKTGSWLAAVVVVAFSVVACAPPTAGPAPFEFHLGGGGKADGVGLLGAEDRSRIDAAFVAAIQAGEAEVKRLEAEIAKLEGAIATKAAEIDSLISQIQSAGAQASAFPSIPRS